MVNALSAVSGACFVVLLAGVLGLGHASTSTVRRLTGAVVGAQALVYQLLLLGGWFDPSYRFVRGADGEVYRDYGFFGPMWDATLAAEVSLLVSGVVLSVAVLALEVRARRRSPTTDAETEVVA